MSFHIYIKNNQKITYKQLLESKFVPKNTSISFGVNPNDFINGYSKLYIPKLSSRGVAITTTENEFDVEINVGATKEDWRLAAKISLALSELNNSLIKPEFDDAKTLEEFENEYDENWIESVKHLSMNSFIQMIKEGQDVILTFMGCIRHFYVRNYVINSISKDTISEASLYDRLIEEIRKIQYIEDYENDLEFPSIRIMDFPEGEKKVTIFLANFKVFIPKVDYVFLLKKGDANVKVAYADFIDFVSPKTKRIDELQYIIYPIDEIEHYKILMHFKLLDETKNLIPKNESKITSKTELVTPTIEKTDAKKWWEFWK